MAPPTRTQQFEVACRAVDEEAVEHRIRPPDVRRRGFAIQGYSICSIGLSAACQEQAAASIRAAAPHARTGRRPRRRIK